MSGALTFITGGARSGKSTFAERLALSHGGRVAYVPTAAVTDGEMASRIAEHRSRRPVDWVTVECPGTLAEALREAGQSASLVLVDCLTVYVARLIPPDLPEDRPVGADVVEAAEATLGRELSALAAAISDVDADVILVSNEVGSGLVPAYPAGRIFRDLVGRANQRLAQAADSAYLVVAGTPLDLKALQATAFPWELRD